MRRRAVVLTRRWTAQYVEQHVGGEEAIVRYAGKDNTAAFHGDQHPKKVAEVLDEVGTQARKHACTHAQARTRACVAMLSNACPLSFTLVVCASRRRVNEVVVRASNSLSTPTHCASRLQSLATRTRSASRVASQRGRRRGARDTHQRLAIQFREARKLEGAIESESAHTRTDRERPRRGQIDNQVEHALSRAAFTLAN